MKVLLAPTVLTTVALSLLTLARSADAQPLGTFRWQLQPFCNLVTLMVVQIGDRYTLDGTDDQCGAPERVSVSGLAFLNPNGSIGFGLTLVAPGARSAHLSATISPVTLSGTWFDSLGQQGSYVFNPAAPTGPARPTIASVRISVSHQNWFTVYESFNLTFTRFANRLAISRPAAGFVVVTAAPDLPVLDNGRRLRLISVQLCYDADATAELSGVEINRTAHATNTLPYFSTIVDTTLRTDETCRNYVLPTPVLVGPNDTFNLTVGIHYVMAGATFWIGRTTFVFEPSFAEAQSLDSEPTDAPAVLTVGSGPAVRKEPPR
jgi:hypothetical protein